MKIHQPPPQYRQKGLEAYLLAGMRWAHDDARSASSPLVARFIRQSQGRQGRPHVVHRLRVARISR
jgi:hypothetical protein